MKTLKMFITMIVMLAGIPAFAQHTNAKQPSKSITASVKVFGNCESCKIRIEKAAKINGVQKVSWNMDSKKLTIVYDPSVTSSENIQKKIASVGHDTEKYRADNKVYNGLPSCCKYDRIK